MTKSPKPLFSLVFDEDPDFIDLELPKSISLSNCGATLRNAPLKKVTIDRASQVEMFRVIKKGIPFVAFHWFCWWFDCKIPENGGVFKLQVDKDANVLGLIGPNNKLCNPPVPLLKNPVKRVTVERIGNLQLLRIRRKNAFEYRVHTESRSWVANLPSKMCK